jgi:hypothetical protein
MQITDSTAGDGGLAVPTTSIIFLKIAGTKRISPAS